MFERREVLECVRRWDGGGSRVRILGAKVWSLCLCDCERTGHGAGLRVSRHGVSPLKRV